MQRNCGSVEVENVTICPICKERTDSIVHLTEQWVLGEIRREHPDWVESSGACRKCVIYYENLEKMVELED